MSTIFSKLRPEAKSFCPSLTANLKESAMNQLCQWGCQDKDQKIVDSILAEWFTAGTLQNILTQWENIPRREIESVPIPLNILCYNVQGWGSRSLEVIDIVYKIEAAIYVYSQKLVNCRITIRYLISIYFIKRERTNMMAYV